MSHNLDTSPEFYGTIITTRTYEDRIDTLANMRAANPGDDHDRALLDRLDVRLAPTPVLDER